jgi:hypothetical protein
MAKSLDGGSGYGDPPKRTQFPKGVSGNPRGRPRGSRGLKADLKTVLHEHVTHPETGKRLRRRELIVRALAARALKGNVAAADKILALEMLAFGLEETQQVEAALSENDALILAQFMGEFPAVDPDAADTGDADLELSPSPSSDGDPDPAPDTQEKD